jgi:hypothetical protein
MIAVDMENQMFDDMSGKETVLAILLLCIFGGVTTIVLVNQVLSFFLKMAGLRALVKGVEEDNVHAVIDHGKPKAEENA